LSRPASAVEANLATAQKLKEKGNAAFKAGDYQAAMQAYHQIYMYVHGYSGGNGCGMVFPGQTTTPVSESEMATIHELKLAHFCNLGMCHLKLGNLPKARINCTKALAIDSTNVKALFRRGKCNAALGSLDEAKADFEGVLELQPLNKEAVRQLRSLKCAFADHKRKEQKRFAGMFERLADVECAESVAHSDLGAAASKAHRPIYSPRDLEAVEHVASALPADSRGSGRSYGGACAAAEPQIKIVSGGARGPRVQVSCGGEGSAEGETTGVIKCRASFEAIGDPLERPVTFEPESVHYSRLPPLLTR